MKRLLAAVLLTAIVFPAVAAAQIKTLPGESITATATVEAIERTSRLLTLKRADGATETIKVPAEVKRFDALKVGDTITATYYENIVLRVLKPGEKDVDSASEALTPTGGKRPGATAAAQRTITATITAIDPAIPSISLSGPTMAFREGMHKGGSVLQEPIMQVEVIVPEEYMGDVLGDLASRRAQIEGMEPRQNTQAIKSLVPLAEMFGYATDLRSSTQGRGVYTMEFHHYQQLPQHLAEEALKGTANGAGARARR